MQKFSSRYAVVKSIQEIDPTDTLDQVGYLKESKWLDTGSGRRGRGRGSRGRGGRGRARGGRGSRGNRSSIGAEFGDENIGGFEKTTRKYARRGRTRGRGGRRRGRRTVRPRQRYESSRVPAVQKEILFSNFNNVSNIVKQDSVESPRSSGGEEWGIEETSRAYIEDDDNSEGSQSDENGQAPGDDYDEQAADYVIDYDDSRPIGLMDDESEDDDDAEGDEEGDEDIEEDEVDHNGHEGVHADVDDEDEDEIGDDEEVGDGVGNGDEGATSFSSEYSD